jgi:hypothetical protein
MSVVSQTPKITSRVLSLEPSYVRISPSSQSHAFLTPDRHRNAQAANAHTGQNRSTERYTRKIFRIPSGTAPHARIRTAEEHGLAPQGKRERALDVPLPDARHCDTDSTSTRKQHAHIGRYCSAMRSKRNKSRTPSRASPHARIRTAQEHGQTLKGWRERASEARAATAGTRAPPGEEDRI